MLGLTLAVGGGFLRYPLCGRFRDGSVVLSDALLRCARGSESGLSPVAADARVLSRPRSGERG